MQCLPSLDSRSSGPVFGTARIRKNVFGFDSFEGFSESVNIDIRMGGRHTDAKRVSGLSDTCLSRSAPEDRSIRPLLDGDSG